MRQSIKVTQNIDQRLDAYLAEELGHTRSFIKNRVREGQVLRNGKPVKAGEKPRAGDIIEIVMPEEAKQGAEAQDIPLAILYQDADIAVVDKPQGMVTHPAAGNADGTLVNAALYHIRDLSGAGGALRPGIVHRLDKDTSGLLVIAKNDAAHVALSEQLRARQIEKTYLALCHGNIKKDEGSIVTNIDRHPKDRKRMAVSRTGREAVTHYKVLERFGKFTLVEFRIETGRTHQIRVHAKHIGHPVAGDAAYTKLKNPFGLNGQLLHAQRLAFRHPGTGEMMEFEAALPDHFARVLDRLRKEA